MSYDLAVWIRPVPADDAEALERYVELMEGMERDMDADPPPAPAPELVRYADELLEWYPDITPDGDEGSPWASGPLKANIVGSVFYFSMTYSAAEDAIPFIVDRAQVHQLVCFDPQTEKLLSRPGASEPRR